MKIVVVGGGIIGLGCAWTLAGKGHQVAVVESGSGVREASWAAAGMLAPHNEADHAGPLWRLGCASLDAWPEFVARLGGAERLDFHQAGSLIPLVSSEDEHEIRQRAEFLSAAGVSVQRVDRVTLHRDEPALAPEIDGGLYLPGAQVDPRRTTEALLTACRQAGVLLHFDQRVEKLGPPVVCASGLRLDADVVVLASGAWSPNLAALTGLSLSGEPVKGQMLRFADKQALGFAGDRSVVSLRLLTRFIHSRHAYVVPRRDQGVVIGSTMVYLGFDRTDDAAAIATLAAGARRLVPALRAWPIAETWTGLRPRLANGLPLIARVRPELVVATGHFRNGILLTPITALAVAALIDGRTPPCDLSPFQLQLSPN